MIRINKIRLATLFLVGILLVSCGTIEQKPTQKPEEKQTVEKPVDFSFEKLSEYDEITTDNPLIKQLVINIPANAATQSVECKISFADKTLWSKTVKVNSTQKEKQIHIEVDPYQPPQFREIYQYPDYKDVIEQYTVTGLSNNNFKNQMVLDVKNNAQLKVSKFLPELKKNSKLKHDFTNKYIVSAIDENDQLNYYIYDKLLSETYKKTVFSIVTSYDCKGFEFINHLSNWINYKPAKNWVMNEACYFAKDGMYYVAYQVHPFFHYITSEDRNRDYEDDDGIPKLGFDKNQKPVREKPKTELPKVLEKHSENDKEIVFRSGYVNIIFDKEKKVFTKEEYVE